MQVDQMIIGLERMRFYAYHGVAPQEREVGNYFTLECRVEAEVSAAMQHDALSETISYAELYEVIAKEMAQPSLLLEHVVGRIASALFDRFPRIKALELSLRKDNPPFPGQLDSASFSIHARR